MNKEIKYLTIGLSNEGNYEIAKVYEDTYAVSFFPDSTEAVKHLEKIQKQHTGQRIFRFFRRKPLQIYLKPASIAMINELNRALRDLDSSIIFEY